jgi:hypothetical protein
MRLAAQARETVLTIRPGAVPRMRGFLDGMQAAGRVVAYTEAELAGGKWVLRVRCDDADGRAVVAYGVSLGATVGEQELFGWEVGR